ncbi:phosphoribosylaminoimidazole carboxylase NCAIR mutase subunit [Loigolactobacillus bifermentans DSM 20003]|uniref:Phosphoribosylaminoimidazole carboxylase NCAIR mutase subunit n=1 Tax=Loigolactobacillus bifermentans DSM 20003 TaxID=1423726 RepID=A0A0R1GK31_9LACO|nr:ATP-grasp domain-containing protein [Loigolactobacillus bifermentans]KRK34444.1 phosphoribosylaminoimidazole carboxylase NCAIR mutase subunit [Loigolactobacillus bifermentans DSM 20003]
MNNVAAIIYPGSTIGIIGGGATSKMMALAAKKMGFRVGILTDQMNSPAASVADFTEVGDMSDVTNLQKLAQFCEVLTYAYENTDTTALDLLQHAYLPQGTDILAITQDRQLEKVFLESNNINIAPYATIVAMQDIYDSVASIGYPCVLKPVQRGIGAQLQHVIYSESDIAACADDLASGTYILEAWVPFERELTVMVAKDEHVAVTLPVVETVYRNRHLHEAITPARVDAPTVVEVERIAKLIGEKLNYIGVFGIEFFLTASGSLYVKRIVPCPHASANLFNEASQVSQYELHIRALCNWPLPVPQPVSPAVSISIPERLLQETYTQVMIKPDWHFYYYLDNAKGPESRVGHVTILTNDVKQTLQSIYDTEIWN